MPLFSYSAKSTKYYLQVKPLVLSELLVKRTLMCIEFEVKKENGKSEHSIKNSLSSVRRLKFGVSYFL